MTTFTYNNDGTPATIKDPAGNMTTLSFDGLGRLGQITFADGASRTVTYNNNNQALTVTDGRGNTTDESILASISDPLGNTISFASDR
ncbi:RHS repeat protein [candidate division KSB1 bacterium]|nr:RHS repeat protein [candidate division KSB1 bacterium]